jgi:hypothetical protein
MPTTNPTNLVIFYFVTLILYVNPVPSGAVGKDCHRRLLSRPSFVRAVAPRIIIIIIIIINIIW